MSDLLKIKVPATSANLGIGFDSMGIAVDKFLEIEAQPHEDWLVTFQSPELEMLPAGAENLVIQVAQKVARQYNRSLEPLHLHMTSEIPLTHGLGSSASAIVAGVELANHYCQLELSTYDKVRLGSAVEGHPDNIGPCVTGGLFVGYYQAGDARHPEELYYEVMDLERVTLIVSVPGYEISTSDAREILPGHYNRQEMAKQNAVSSLMLLASMKKDYDKMGELMMKDLIHEPYRQILIPEFTPLKELTLNLGAYATVISGAGPTLLTLCHEDDVSNILEALEVSFPSCSHEEVQVVPSR